MSTNAFRNRSAVYKRMGLATNGFGIVGDYPRKALQLLPLFLVGAADTLAGKRHRSIGHFRSPYFAKIHRG